MQSSVLVLFMLADCEPRFNGSFLRDNLPRIKDVCHKDKRPYVINLDENSKGAD